MISKEAFKNILETIETGLYEKWENNLMNPEKPQKEIFKLPKSVDEFLFKTPTRELLEIAFSWYSSPEEGSFWYHINTKVQRIILENAHQK